MGTYKLRPTVLVSGGTPLNFFGPDTVCWYTSPSFADPLVNVLGHAPNGIDTAGAVIANFSTNPNVIHNTARFSFFGFSVYLDGSLIPISDQSLPSGFTPTLTIVSFNPLPDVQPPAGSGHARYFLQFDVFHEGPENINTFTYPTNLSAIDLINNGCGIRMDIDVNDLGDQAQIIDGAELVIDGEYIIASSTFSPIIENSDIPIYSGDKVFITVPPAQSSLRGVSQIQLSFTDIDGPHLIQIITDQEFPILIIDGIFYAWINLIFEWLDFSLGFYLPFGFNNFVGPVTVTLLGTTFSGSVVAGVLQILFADASGIYTLDNNQISDLLYFRQGYTTDIQRLFLVSDDDEVDNDTLRFYEMLPDIPPRILAYTDIDEDFEPESFQFAGILRVVVVTRDVEIPSPYIKTGFLP